MSATGLTGIGVKLDGVTADSGLTSLDFEADDFDYNSSQIKLQQTGTTRVLRQTWTGDVAAALYKLKRAVLEASRISTQTVTQSGNAVTIDYDAGDVVDITTTGNVTTWTLNNLPTDPAQRWTLTVFLKLGGAHTISFPATFKTPGGLSFVPSGNGKTDIIQLSGRGGDTNIAVNYAQDFSL